MRLTSLIVLHMGARSRERGMGHMQKPHAFASGGATTAATTTNTTSTSTCMHQHEHQHQH